MQELHPGLFAYERLNFLERDVYFPRFKGFRVQFPSDEPSDTPDRKEFVMGQIKYRFGDVMRTMFVDNPMTMVTDQSQLYKFLTDIKDHNNRPKFQHEVCRHDLNKYASSNGVSSNRLEVAFAHKTPEAII